MRCSTKTQDTTKHCESEIGNFIHRRLHVYVHEFSKVQRRQHWFCVIVKWLIEYLITEGNQFHQLTYLTDYKK